MDCTYGSSYDESNMKADLIQRNRELFGKLYGGYGCSGSWMEYTYDFLIDHGAVDVSRASYTASESLCTHEPADIVAKGTNYQQVTGSIEAMKQAVALRPVTVAINASSTAFQYYDGGVIRAHECSTSQNHAVVIVGYSDSSDTNPGPTPDPDVDPTPDPDVDPTPTACKVTKWWHSCPQAESRRLTDSNGLNNYWKVQNSWSTGYGDNGFVLFDMQEGDGVCGINNYVEYVDMYYV